MSLTIRAKLIIAAVVTAACAMTALTAANFLAARSTTVASAQAGVHALEEGYARLIGDWVAAKTDVVKSLAPAVEAGDPLPILLQAKTAGGFDTTYVGWADKRHSFSSPQNLPPDWDPTARPWYRQAEAARAPILTSPYEDAGTKKLVVTFAIPVTGPDGKVKAVTAGDIFIDHIVEAVNGIRPSEHSYAYLVDNAGLIIAHPDAKKTLKPATSVAASLDAARLKALREKRAFEKASIDGTAYWLSVHPVPNTDWSLVMAFNEADALAGVARMGQISAGLGLVLVIVTGLVLAALVTRLLTRLFRLREALEDIASGHGDLTRRLDATGHDELASVGRSFNLFVDKIAGILRSIRRSTESVNVASGEIATGNQDLSSRTERAASALQETASTMEQLSGAVRQTADSASTANALATDAADTAARGGEVVSRVVATMADINESAKRIADINNVIDGIAFQTNILALNAAVEAARAGTHGAGFAVVASEVRMLAQRSAEAAKEIKALIGSSVARVEDGTTLVADAGAVMTELVGGVRKVSDMIRDITAAAGEQSTSIEQVGAAVTHLDEMTQQNAALVEQSAAAAESLREQARTLATAVAGFKLAER